MNAITSTVTNWPVMRSPFATLIRREFWEYRSLWIAPLVVSGLLLFSVVAGALLGHGEIVYDSDTNQTSNYTALMIGVLSISMPQFVVMLVMLFFYLIDCLYTERKDRSILFWKSMPVSDTATVLSKLLTALVVVPIGVFAVSLVTDLIVGAIMAMSVHGGSAFWDTATWLKVRAAMIPGLALVLLWYAPIAAYLLLLSAWARRNVFLWVVLPPLLLMVVENRSTGTHYVATFLQYRFSGVWRHFGTGGGITDWSVGMQNLTQALMDSDLWLGLVAAALFTYAAIRIRRYRDDTY